MLTCTETKNKLTKFLADSWQEPSRREKLCGQTIFVASQERCFKLTCNTCEEVYLLATSQEEADTRLFLHAQTHRSLVFLADDTDVFVICLGLSSYINCNMNLRRGTKTRVRMVDIARVSTVLGSEMCSLLPGLHAWTGCDTVSALANQKNKSLENCAATSIYRQASLGSSWSLAPETFSLIQKFTCQLYSKNTKITKVNDLRYQVFCAKNGDVESGQLPPCEDTLRQHTLRANYQAAIWRHSLESLPDIPEPSAGHGWELNTEGDLTIQWMIGEAAPNAVLSLISCKCTRSCHHSDCSCMLNGLKCTMACKLQNCSNMAQEAVEDKLDSSDTEYDSDDN